MAHFAARLADLSPDRRRLLTRLLGEGTAHQRTVVPTGTADDPAPHAVSPEKAECRRFYDGINRQLDASDYGPFSLFLNLGYSGDTMESVVTPPERCLSLNSVRLVLELVGSCDLAGCRVLDVGCGRGGTLAVVSDCFRPASVTGLDLSPEAITFCRRAQRPGARFEVGDAERLPLADGSMDVVMNVESSSTYPDVFAFFREVVRVLSPGGRFLYTDALPVDRFAECRHYLSGCGLTVERDRDITHNVLLSCDQVARQHRQAYRAGAGKGLDDFLATPGSHIYEAMRRGEWTYRIQRWRKGAYPHDAPRG